MPAIFIVIFLAYISGNIYVFYRGLQAIADFPLVLKIVLGVLYWLGALSFLSLLKMRDGSISAGVGHVLHDVGTGWLVFTLYMVLMLAVIDIFKLFHLQYQYSFHVALGLTVCLLTYGYYNFKNPRTEFIDIKINKSLDKPQTKLKVVAISDIHLGYGTDKVTLKEYVDKINALQPDLILIAGDLIDSSVAPLDDQHMEEELSLLKAPLGVYMALGNHEYISDVDRSVEFIRKTPICLLRDSMVTLPNQIQIIGRDDKHNHSRKHLAELVEQADKSKPIIVLDHQPFELGHVEKAGADLQFSGHTHKGQVWPISWLTDHIFEVSHGHLVKGETNIYVSSGLSLWGPPFRIGTNSELAVFNITFN